MDGFIIVNTIIHETVKIDDGDILPDLEFHCGSREDPYVVLELSHRIRNGSQTSVLLSRSEMLTMIKFMDENTDA